jgi:hypothetical protein
MARRTKRKTRIYARQIKKKLKRTQMEENFNIIFIKKVGQANCHYCAPFDGENFMGKKHGKHGKTKPKYKNKRH